MGVELFSRVRRRHVLRAMERVRLEGVPGNRRARSTSLLHGGQLFPAKYVLGLAYELATKRPLLPDDYTGGEATGRVLRTLGFAVMRGAVSTTGHLGNDRPESRAREGPARSGLKGGKAALLRRLEGMFGAVELEKRFAWLRVPHRVGLPPSLRRIHDALQAMRGFRNFARPGLLLQCDYYLPLHQLVIEVDERQHFTEARKVALENYPADLPLGFDRAEWIARCEEIGATDNDPPFRDEQRAFYDSVRDVLIPAHGLTPMVRLYQKDLESKERLDMVMQRVAEAAGEKMVARVVVRKRQFTPSEGQRILLDVLERRWPGRATVKFLITPGGFLWVPLHPPRPGGNRGWDSTPADIEPFICAAKPAVQKAVSKRVVAAARGKAEVLTIGVDVGFAKDDYAACELVAVIDLSSGRVIQWTGKSYPIAEQERSLVQVVDLKTHLVKAAGERVLVLGCHDLNMFNPRADKTRKGERRKRCDEMRQLVERFRPTVVLQHPHDTDHPSIWRMGWSGLRKSSPSIKAWASGICYKYAYGACRDTIEKVLAATCLPSALDIEVR